VQKLYFCKNAGLQKTAALGNAPAGEAPASRDRRRTEAGAWERGNILKFLYTYLFQQYRLAFFNPVPHNAN